MSVIDKAIICAGGVQSLATRLNVRYQMVQKWRKRGFFPYDRAKDIEQATKCAVMRHEMFPELFDGYAPVKRKRRKSTRKAEAEG